MDGRDATDGRVDRVTAPRASGPPASPPGSSRRRPGRRRWSSTTGPARRRGRRVHHQPGQGRAGAAGSQQVLAAGAGSRAVVLNSGGANACTGPGASRTPRHRRARRPTAARRRRPVDVAVCSTGLIGERLPMDRLLAGVDAAAARAVDRDGGADAAAAIMTTDTRAEDRRVVTDDGLDGRRDGQGRRHARARPGHHAGACSPPTRSPTPPTLDAALRAATRVTLRPDRLRRLHVHQRHRAAAGQRRVRRRRPQPSELTAAVTAVCRDLAQQLLADAEGATKDIAIEVVRRRQRGRRGRGRPGGRPQQPGQDRAVRRTTRTGAGSWPRSAPPAAAFDPDELDVAINGVWICRDGGAGEDRSKVDLSGRAVRIVDRPARRRRDRDHLDQRPVARPTSTRTRRTRHERPRRPIDPAGRRRAGARRRAC